MISVIMPVYNAYRIKGYLNKAIHSVLNQSVKDVELIIVNDGSTDKTQSILDKVARMDKRIRLIEKENGGVESARRTGLAQARGEFIMHIDQDDYYRKDAFECYLKHMEADVADVVFGNSSRFLWHPAVSKNRIPKAMAEELLLSQEDFMKEYYISFFGVNILPVNIWNKMYRASFLERVPMPPLTGSVIEDLSYNMHVLPYARSIKVIPDVLYYYRWGGYTNHYDPTILFTALTGYRLKMNQIEMLHLGERFIRTTSIELLNYLNTYFYTSVLYEELPWDTFKSRAEDIFRRDDVCDALKVVKACEYRNPHVEYMLEGDFHGLYLYELQSVRHNRMRNIIKRMLLK